MTEKNQDILEQNKRINELTRKVARLEIDMDTLKQAIEPDGWISQAFEKMEEHLSEHDRRFDKIDHNLAQLRSSLNHIIDHLTKLSDLPEE